MARKESPPAFDLRHALVEVTSPGERLVQKAAQVLVEEVTKRTRHQWPITTAPSGDRRPTIVLTVSAAANQPADGFQLRTQVTQGIPQLDIIGNDARGVLFGVGYLLRHLQMSKGQVTLPQALNLTTAPHYALRGHQIGYRDKTNAYDGWDLPQWEQYMRELAIFGTNAIELIPPLG